MRAFVAVAALVGILAYVNVAIYKKEHHLKSGQTVLLELAPVDPRSLMQGDYMRLRFAVTNQLSEALRPDVPPEESRGLAPADGWAVLTLEEGVGRFAGLADSSVASEGVVHVAYRVRSGRVKFATDAYFFQEGTAEIYENGRYGEFRIDADGELLLIGLRDENKKRLGPAYNSEPAASN
ncbi:MAG: GDYXXLXY domain-containing protein [Pseudomonadota bacterium]